MRVLLESNLPRAFTTLLPGHRTDTTHQGRWSDLGDDPHLDAADAEYDAFVTMDQSLRFQQTLRGRKVCVVVVRAPSNTVAVLDSLGVGLSKNRRMASHLPQRSSSYGGAGLWRLYARVETEVSGSILVWSGQTRSLKRIAYLFSAVGPIQPLNQAGSSPRVEAVWSVRLEIADCVVHDRCADDGPLGDEGAAQPNGSLLPPELHQEGG